MTESERPDGGSGFLKRFRYSVFPGPLQPRSGQRGYRRYFNSLVLHFRPRTVDERTLRFSLSWGLGGMAAVLVLLLFATGLLLKFYYAPFPDRAYESILYIREHVPFGGLIRNIHHWSANGLIVVAFLHLLRVYFTGAFLAPRQFNWVIGCGLLATVVLSNFTGYLMPWDQLAFWAVTICGGMLEYVPWAGMWLQQLLLGGDEVGTATLSNFYALHTSILPALLIILLPFHFWRVRKAGGLVVHQANGEKTTGQVHRVDSIPHLLVREVVTALVLLAVVLVVSMAADAPLADKANPGLSPNPTKAPWYFAGFQEMLVHFHPLFALFIIPALMLTVFLALPYLNYQRQNSCMWFGSVSGRRAALAAAAAAVVLTLAGVLADEYLFALNGRSSILPAVVSGGVIPFGVILAVCILFYVWMKKKMSRVNNDAIQAVFVLLITSFLVLTAICIWFRGPEMKLMWPWQV